MKCTCAYSWGAQAITPWYEKISQARMEQIKMKFALKKPMNEEGFALPERTAENTPTGAPSEKPPAVISLGSVAEYYTGYARIDNAIVDALKGRGQELKDSVYDIIRNDLVPNHVHGLEEEDRLALISLGVEKAQYLADQFMDGGTRASFMTAIRSIAKIGAAGTRVGNCEMKYNVKNVIGFDGTGHVMENQSDEFLFAMERLSPGDYETYKKMYEAGGDSAREASFFALRWAMANIDAVAGYKTTYNRYKDEQYAQLDKVELDQTFAGADTSGKVNFLESIREKLQENQRLQINFFLEQIAKMTEGSGGYLTARQKIVRARA
ncbi:MAG TPA: hypothetical protein DF613_03790 [Lachnospiraceae bacterium]|nr:hypothetical protein [Lachnospiraceae bacterium]